MAENSHIEWTDATWNPVKGCSRVSPGCANCFAVGDTWRMGHNPNNKIRAANEGLVHILPNGRKDWTGVLRPLSERLATPLSWTRPRRVFVNSQSDLFHPAVPFNFIDQVFGVMAICPRHTFQILTKRPERMAHYLRDYATPHLWGVGMEKVAGIPSRKATTADAQREVCNSPYPLPNVHLGTSAEDQRVLDLRLPSLRSCLAAVRFLSIEPLLEPIVNLSLSGIHWVIVGGESGPGARPCNVKWVRDIVSQCQAAGVPVFVKQLGQNVEINREFGCLVDFQGQDMSTVSQIFSRSDTLPFKFFDKKGSDITEWPEDLRVREFPGTDRRTV